MTLSPEAFARHVYEKLFGGDFLSYAQREEFTRMCREWVEPMQDVIAKYHSDHETLSILRAEFKRLKELKPAPECGEILPPIAHIHAVEETQARLSVGPWKCIRPLPCPDHPKPEEGK